jgi:hypothetical protein
MWGLVLLAAPAQLSAESDADDSSSETADANAPDIAHLEIKRTLAAEVCGDSGVAVANQTVGCREPYYDSPLDSPVGKVATSLTFYPDALDSDGRRYALVAIAGPFMSERPEDEAILFRKTSAGWKRLDTAGVQATSCRPVTLDDREPLLVCPSRRSGKNWYYHGLRTLRVDGDTLQVRELLEFDHGNCVGMQYCTPGDLAGGSIRLDESSWRLEADPPVVVVDVEVTRVTDSEGCDSDEENCEVYAPRIPKEDNSTETRDFRKETLSMTLRYELRDGRLELVEEDRPKIEIFDGDPSE